MDNQYSYYMPEGDEDEKGFHTVDHYEDPYQEKAVKEESDVKKKRRKKTSGFGKVIVSAILFGIIASAVFLGITAAGFHVFGIGKTTVIETTKTIESDSEETKPASSNVSGIDVPGVVKNVMPSIVSITNMSVQEVYNFFGGVQQQESKSCGSGIIIEQTDSELLILTNNHVVAESNTLTVTFEDEESVDAQIKGTDSDRDLAVVAVNLSDIKEETMKIIKAATMGDSNSLTVGEPVIAIGNALGYGQSVTTGVVSAVKRENEEFEGTYIQTDAAINPGNSGGALLNANGEVIGINSAKIASSEVEGMGYAIPISDVTDIISNLTSKTTRKKVSSAKQGYIGIKGVDIAGETAKTYNMPEGVYISEVMKGGGAEKAGLEQGDIITKFDGNTISGMDDLQSELQYFAIGETVKITIQHPKDNNYEEKEVEVTLTKQLN